MNLNKSTLSKEKKITSKDLFQPISNFLQQKNQQYLCDVSTRSRGSIAKFKTLFQIFVSIRDKRLEKNSTQSDGLVISNKVVLNFMSYNSATYKINQVPENKSHVDSLEITESAENCALPLKSNVRPPYNLCPWI